jgi:hypothetical protein
MKYSLIAFLAVGFIFGFAATVSDKKAPAVVADNFDFLYGQWEVLGAQGLKDRKPASLDDKSLNFVLEEDVYLDSNAVKANGDCSSGVAFQRFSRSEQKDFLKRARSMPLLKSYFGDGKRDGIWSGKVVCNESAKPLWTAIMLSRRQLFLVSQSDVVELYKREIARPIQESFTDTDAEVSTE